MRGDRPTRVSTWAALTSDQRHRVLGSLASLALLFFDQTAVVVALPAIRHEFGATYNAAEWTVTIYLLALAVFMPVAGRVAERFGDGGSSSWPSSCSAWGRRPARRRRRWGCCWLRGCSRASVAR